MRYLVWLFICAFCSCGSKSPSAAVNDSTPATTVQKPAKENFERSKVLQLSCKSDNSSYALYLPANYDTAKTWPVVVFLDPHAAGSLPLEKYKTLAEDYGFVFAGSNVSKNGMDINTVVASVNTLIADVQARLSLDPKRLYICGFSGGSRSAGAVAAQRMDVAGVIGCSAGFTNPQAAQAPVFACIGIAGMGDMNYNEVQREQEALTRMNARSAFFPFEGKHEWPPLQPMECALLWLNCDAMKNGALAKDTAAVNRFSKKLYEPYDAWTKRDRLTAAMYWKDAVSALDGLTDVTVSKQKLAYFLGGEQYKTDLAKEQAYLAKEQELQNVYAQALTQKGTDWWEDKKNFAPLDTSARLAARERLMHLRVWGYLSLMCYSYSNQALRQNQWTAVDQFVYYYSIVDPKNSEWAYMRAQVELVRNDKEKALAALETAVALGFKDRGRMETEPAFQPVFNEPRFQAVLQKAGGK